MRPVFSLITLCIIGNNCLAEGYWPNNIKEECKLVRLAYLENNIKYMMELDRSKDEHLRQSCKPDVGRYFDYKKADFYYTCNTLKHAVLRGAITAVKAFEQVSTRKEQEICMRFAVHQNIWSGRQEQYHTFKYALDRLANMELHDQQKLFDELLAGPAVTGLAHAPQFAAYLLDLGANPVRPTKDDSSVLSWALWVTNDGGSCETVRLLVKKMKPENFSIRYKNSPDGQLVKGIYVTPLMEAADMTTFCAEEKNLMARKAAKLNQQDANGDTVLHYLYRRMARWVVIESDLTMVEILLERGASLDIPNQQKITPNDRRIQLKNNKDQCGRLCGRI